MSNTDLRSEDFWWCMHCCRTWEEVTVARTTPEKCRYTKCGKPAIDIWPWSVILKENSITYPRIPSQGIYYPPHHDLWLSELEVAQPLTDTGERPALSLEV